MTLVRYGETRWGTFYINQERYTMTEEPKQDSLKDLSQDSERKKEELHAELNRVFDYHAPVGHIVDIHDVWRTEIKMFATDLMGLPPTRERAMALTRLEECSFWIHATIARNHDKFPAPVSDAVIDECIDVADGKHDIPLGQQLDADDG